MGAIADLVRRYAAGETDPCLLTAALLEQAAGGGHEAVFTRLTPELALRDARAAAARRRAGQPLGALDGVPLSWKDLFDVEGCPTTCGSMLTPRRPAARDSACVARLRVAGAVGLGKTNLSEFAFSGLGINPHFGTPTQRAPRSGRAHLVGGSSSGAAAAVKAGLGVVALGTDTSGSIRVPAAWSGLVGFRPSLGRYPVEGVARLAPSLDTVGIIAPTVADVLAVDAVLAGRCETPAAAAARFVLVENFSGPDVQPELRANALDFMARLERAGHACETRRVPAFDDVLEAFDRHGALVSAEAARQLAPYARQPRLDPFVRWRLEQARALPAGARGALLRLREPLVAAMQRRREIFVFPTTPRGAPALDELGSLEAIARANAQALRHTMPCSFLDMPGINLPCGQDVDGLPTGVLLSCGRGGDARLLAAAAELELRQIWMS